jgi:hypothetical protein
MGDATYLAKTLVGINSWDYTFRCDVDQQIVHVTASNDNEALQLAKLECADCCEEHGGGGPD